MVALSATRVPDNTERAVNRAIAAETAERLRYYERHPERIPERLAALDAEWDIERTLEANASTLALAGVVLAAVADRRWLALSAGVTAFLLQHAVQGWCPPLPVLRRLGFRTVHEIERERYALRAIRGDFRDVGSGAGRIGSILQAFGFRS
jgi:hypothetical protein